MSRQEIAREGLRPGDSKHRSTSISNRSSSISTISTSRSSSPFSPQNAHTGQTQSMAELHPSRKRRRSSSSMSYTSLSSRDERRAPGHSERSKGAKLKRAGSTSGWREHSSNRRSPPRSSHREAQNASARNIEREKRRKHASRSPVDRGRHRDIDSPRRWRRSSTASRDRSEIARHREYRPSNSISEPFRRRQGPPNGHSHDPEDRGGYSSSQRRYPNQRLASPQGTHKQRDRSLSPFSKRLAMTQAMNSG